jgi:hypothetical protein
MVNGLNSGMGEGSSLKRKCQASMSTWLVHFRVLVRAWTSCQAVSPVCFGDSVSDQFILDRGEALLSRNKCNSFSRKLN